MQIEKAQIKNKLIHIKTNFFLYLVRNFSMISFFLREDLKVTVMQIEKAQINNKLIYIKTTFFNFFQI